MRIKKISPRIPANGNIYNTYGTSQENTYSQEYINNIHLTELLGSTGLTQGNSYQLSDNITNYKYIMIVLSTSGMFQNANRQYIPVSQIADYTTDYRCALSLFQSTTVYVFVDLYFDAVNSIKCNGYTKGTTGWNGAIRVYGIK